MPSNKDRLYLALYVRGGAAKMPGKEDTYHWALIVGPKNDKKDGQIVRYHARERIRPDGSGSEWFFEEKTLTVMNTQMILVRIMIAKIERTDRLAEVLRQIPIRQGQEGWNCVSWVREALAALEASKNVLGTSAIGWEAVRDAAMSYCQQKKEQHRFDGKGNFDTSQIPTFDLLQQKETTA